VFEVLSIQLIAASDETNGTVFAVDFEEEEF